VAYKKDIDDLRESPALDVSTVNRRGPASATADPFIPRLR